MAPGGAKNVENFIVQSIGRFRALAMGLVPADMARVWIRTGETHHAGHPLQRSRLRRRAQNVRHRRARRITAMTNGDLIDAASNAPSASIGLGL